MSQARGRYVGLAVGALGVVMLAVVGLVSSSRVPVVDEWGLRELRVEPGSATETLVAGASDGLRAASVAVAAAAIGWLLWRGRRRALAPALGYVLLFLVLASSSEILKEVFARPHPIDPADVSYPSTHVAMAVVAITITAAIASAAASRETRGLVAALTIAVVVATAATRVLLGEHYLTDVLATAVGYLGASVAGVWLLRSRTGVAVEAGAMTPAA